MTEGDFLLKLYYIYMAQKKFYAYFTEKNKGIAISWPECQKIVSGVAGAKYKGFLTQAEAKRWLDGGADYNVKHIAAKKGIYFDSGTGAGRGVEINVTNEKGNSLLGKVLPKEKLNSKGHHWIFQDLTNNYGELLSCKYALEIAIKSGIKKVFGDSKLVMEFWSKGIINRKEVPMETFKLAIETKELRNEFEKNGGILERIAGASNPADLGYHKG
jgi:ribonuclease H-related protein